MDFDWASANGQHKNAILDVNFIDIFSLINDMLWGQFLKKVLLSEFYAFNVSLFDNYQFA